MSQQAALINKRAFTLMEIAVVVVILATILAVGVPLYFKAVSRSRERDAVNQLKVFYGANDLYKSRTGHYFNQDDVGLDEINQALKMNFMANGMVYVYHYYPAVWWFPERYDLTASWNNPGDDDYFAIRVDQREIYENELGYSSNPCCSAGSCQTVENCN